MHLLQPPSKTRVLIEGGWKENQILNQVIFPDTVPTIRQTVQSTSAFNRNNTICNSFTLTAIVGQIYYVFDNSIDDSTITTIFYIFVRFINYIIKLITYNSTSGLHYDEYGLGNPEVYIFVRIILGSLSFMFPARSLLFLTIRIFYGLQVSFYFTYPLQDKFDKLALGKGKSVRPSTRATNIKRVQNPIGNQENTI